MLLPEALLRPPRRLGRCGAVLRSKASILSSTAATALDLLVRDSRWDYAHGSH